MHMAAPRFSTNVVTSATWAAPDASPTSQTTSARAFTRLSIYKGKAAMQLSIIPPTWSSVPGDIFTTLNLYYLYIDFFFFQVTRECR